MSATTPRHLNELNGSDYDEILRLETDFDIEDFDDEFDEDFEEADYEDLEHHDAMDFQPPKKL